MQPLSISFAPDTKPRNYYISLCADEIDAIAAKRETAQREMERRIVAQMLTCMDDLSEQPLMEEANSTGQTERGDPACLPKHVVVIGMVFQKIRIFCEIYNVNFSF